MSAGAAPATAVLTATDGPPLPCQFNPSTVQIQKSAQWNTPHTTGSRSQPRPQFVGTGPSVLTVDLLFDSFDTTGRTARTPVKAAVEQLMGWTTPSAPSQATTTPEPATVTFTWGCGLVFTGFIKALSATYTLFSSAGEPQRATVHLQMQSIPQEPAATNPTSGGVAGRAGAVLSDADSLASIAYREYGDAALWRAVALANGIDDPGRVPPGTRVLLPPRTQALALAAVGGGE